MPQRVRSDYLAPMRALPLRIPSAIALATTLGCYPGPVASPPSPVPPEPTPPHLVVETEEQPPPLPPVPRVVGPLDLRVVYPPEGAQVAARDSNFVYGSVGSGAASLTINGMVVPVQPNGAFLAFLPVPPGPQAVYRLEAIQGADTARLERTVRAPAPPVPLLDEGRLVVDSVSLAPRSRLAVQRWEPVRVSVRAPRNANVELQLATGERVPMVNLMNLDSATAPAGRDPHLFATEVAAAHLHSQAWVQVTRGVDTVRLALARVALADSAGRRFAVVGAAATTLPDTDRVITARPVAGGTYKWFLLPGTIVEVTGSMNGAARIRLDAALQVFVNADELSFLPEGTPAPRRIAGNARVVSAPGWSDLRIPIAAVPPYNLDVEERALVLTLYGTTANTDIITFASRDPVIRRVTWRQVASDRAEFRVELHDAPYGYLVFRDQSTLVLRVRRRPEVNAEQPLAGLVIAVDAGHPPGGTTGPTGLYEPVVTLAVAERVRTYLEQRGARVVMTRVAPGAVPLYDRPVQARRAEAHAFVSIHLNAFPDGINPFGRHGTGSYYFNAFSEPLARAVQAGMVRRLGLPDLGVYYDNLAVLRPTWMPSVLCEGAFLMIPEIEAALRTPEIQDAYARGVVEGVEQYFRGLGAAP